MGKQKAPPPPNLQPISDAQVKIADQQYQLAQQYLGLSQQQFDFMKQNAGQELTFAQQQADRSFGLQQQALDTQKGIEAAAQQVSNAQLSAMQQAQTWAQQDRARYQSVFQPLQDQMVQYAKDYASPTRMSENAAMAMGDVNTQFANARAAADERLRSMGVDPSQVQSASLLNQMGVQNAANTAMAGNNARIQTQLQGQALMGNAVNMGSGLPSQALGAMGTGTAAGNSAVGAAGAGQAGALGAINASTALGGTGLGMLSNAINTYGSATGSPMQWANFGSNLMSGANSTYGSAANTQMSQFNAGLNAASMNNQATSSEIGNVASIAALAMMAGGGVVPDSNIAIDPASIQVNPDTSAMLAVHMPVSHVAAAGGARAQQAQALFNMGRGMASTPFNPINDQVAPTQEPMYDPTAGAIQYQQQALPISRAMGGPVPMGPGTTPGSMPGTPAGGGPVPTHQSVDKVHAMLTPGEYVVPKDVVASKGIEFFDNLVKKYHRPGA
jgi:hypothetical protein